MFWEDYGRGSFNVDVEFREIEENNRMGKTRDLFMEKAVAPDSSTLAWKIPWTEEPGRLRSIGSLRVGHD